MALLLTLVLSFPVLIAAAYANLGNVLLSRAILARGASPLNPFDQSWSAHDPEVAEAGRALEMARTWQRGSVATERQLAVARLAGGEHAAAAQMLAPMQEAGRTDTLVGLTFASALYRQGRIDEAVDVWRDTGAGEFVVWSANRSDHQSSLGQIVARYELASRVASNRVAVHLGRAGALDRADQRVMAIAEYERALELGARAPIAANRLGRLLLRERRYPEAAEAFGLALEWHPGYPPYLLDLAEAYRLMGDHAAADAVLREAVVLDARNPWLLVKLGENLAQWGRELEGLAAIEGGIRMWPASRDAWVVLGGVYWNQLRDPASAARAYECVVAIDPDYTWAQEALARAYGADGRSLQEAREYIAAASVDPNARPSHCR